MMCDLGTGNKRKPCWVLEDRQDLIEIIETNFGGTKKGRGLVSSPKGMLNLCFCLGEVLTVLDSSTRYR